MNFKHFIEVVFNDDIDFLMMAFIIGTTEKLERLESNESLPFWLQKVP